MVMEDNMVIEFNLARGVAGGLAAADLDVYRAPFLEPASRKPMLAWTREFPLDGEPADVVEVVLGCGRWMAGTPEVPKLIMAVESGVGLGSPEVSRLGCGELRRCRSRVCRARRPPDT